MKNKELNIKLALAAAFSFCVLVISLFARSEKKIYKDLNLKSDTIIRVKPSDTVVSVKGKKVLYIGDSHTTYAYGWQDRLCRRTGMSYINTAVGGKTTSWMLGVLRNNISSNFDYCIIWGGANDMAGNTKIKDAVHNVQKMVDICNSKGVKAIVMTGFSPKDCVDVSRQSAAWQPYPKRYDIFQQMLQDSIKGATVIKSHFISRRDRDCGDFCCHMAASGHIKMADSMISRLKFKIIK